MCPVTAYDKNGVRVLLHFATDCPAGRPDVLVMVASMLNTAPLPVSNIVLQAAVPKVKTCCTPVISLLLQWKLRGVCLYFKELTLADDQLIKSNISLEMTFKWVAASV